MERDCVHIRKMRLIRCKQGGSPELWKSISEFFGSHQRETERVVEGGVLRRRGETRAQHSLGIGFASLRAEDISKIHVRRRMPSIETNRGAVLACGLVQPPELREKNSKRNSILGTIRLKSLTRDELRRRAREIIFCIAFEQSRRRRENSRSLNSHRSRRIPEQWSRNIYPVLRRIIIENLQGRSANQCTRVAHSDSCAVERICSGVRGKPDQR